MIRKADLIAACTGVERNSEIRLIYVKLLFTLEVKLRKFTYKLVKH
jgi:hypothetical protein